MPKFSALLHARNSSETLGRALETLRVCDEIVVVDHHSTDDTVHVARQYGASVIAAVTGVEQGAYATDCRHDWILCLQPNESLSDALEASLNEWKQEWKREESPASAFALRVREQHGRNWRELAPEVRLVDRTCVNWTGALPANVHGAPLLPGDLLRFSDARS